MIDIYKLIKGISVKHKVGSNDDSEMVPQFSSSSHTDPGTCSCFTIYTTRKKTSQLGCDFNSAQNLSRPHNIG